MNLTQQLHLFKKDGIIKIKNFLSPHQVSKIIKGIKPFIGSKGDVTTYFSNNYKKNFLKLLKFRFSKFLISNYLIKISKEKKNETICQLSIWARKFLKYDRFLLFSDK